jgi:hypothetical protein
VAGDETRPTPLPTAIDLTERHEILRGLLESERARLANALRLEKERSIVFPETTVIIRDIERLVDALGLPDTRQKSETSLDPGSW